MKMAKVKVKRKKAVNIAYIEHMGPYKDIPFEQYYKQLFSWARRTKARPGFKTMAIYLNDPHSVPEKNILTRVAIITHKKGKAEDDIKAASLPEMETAVIKHRGPAEEYANSYALLHEWMNMNGYRAAGSPMEIFSRRPKVKKGKAFFYSTIHFPVKKK